MYFAEVTMEMSSENYVSEVKFRVASEDLLECKNGIKSEILSIGKALKLSHFISIGYLISTQDDFGRESYVEHEEFTVQYKNQEYKDYIVCE